MLCVPRIPAIKKWPFKCILDTFSILFLIAQPFFNSLIKQTNIFISVVQQVFAKTS